MASVSAQKKTDNLPKSTANHADDRNGIKMPAVQVLHQQPAIQRKKNNTVLPDNLKSGIEALSGFSMNDVKVHYNSAKPAQLQAFAYAQGTDIHIGPGHEKHLPHEAWHVAQQKQGRVQPTMQMKAGAAVNDDKGLESEADTMGAKAVNVGQLAKIGNAGMLNTVQYKSDPGFAIQFYKANRTQKSALLSLMTEKWGKAMKSSDAKFGPTIDGLTSYCENHSQAMSILEGMDYMEWSQAKEEGATAKDLIADLAPSVVTEGTEEVVEGKEELLEEKKAKPKITSKNVRLMIKDTRYSRFTFSGADITAICAAKDPAEAIKAIGDRKIRAEDIAKREAIYSGAKTAGNAIFTTGLVREIWNYSYAVVIGGGGLNATLPGQHADGDILAAVAIWDGVEGSLQAPGRRRTAVTKPAKNFHVPGDPLYIQDKKTRDNNPDPDRRRQADFICKWGELKINVHVDSETRRL